MHFKIEGEVLLNLDIALKKILVLYQQEYLGEKNTKISPCRTLLFYVAHDVFIKVSLFQEICSAQKILGCAHVTFSLTFHTNAWLFVNLSIYWKLIQDNINHKFSIPRIYFLALFWMRYDIFCAYKYLHQKLWLIFEKYILFLFIKIGIMIFVSVILKKMQIIFLHNYLRCFKIPKRYISICSNISDYVV